MNMISGLEKPTSGEIYFDEQPITRLPPGARNVGFVFQNYAIFTHMSVAENISFGLRVSQAAALGGGDRSQGRRRIADVLGLRGMLDRNAVAALGERHAEGRARPQHDREPCDLPPGRAVLEPRCGLPRLHAGRAQADPARDRADDGLRHPRSGRSDEHGRPHRGHGSGSSCSSTGHRTSCTTRRRTVSWPGSSDRRR